MKAIFLIASIATVLTANITLAKGILDVDATIGETLTLFDIEILYDKTELESIKAQIISDKEMLYEIYETIFPKEDPIEGFNKLIGLTLIQLKALENSDENSSFHIDEAAYSKLDFDVIDKMIELYSATLRVNLLINTSNNGFVSDPSKAELNKKIRNRHNMFADYIANNTNIIVFFMYCKAMAHHDSITPIDEVAFAEGLYYLHSASVLEVFKDQHKLLKGMNRSRYWLSIEAKRGSNLAAAILGVIYNIEQTGNMFNNTKQLSLLAKHYLNQGENYELKGGDPDILYAVGGAYLSQNKREQAIRWFQVAAKYNHAEAKKMLNRLQK